ncbi:hypothetical protein HDE_12508 [Halotydeus destructor]|nr:hypothetical protein HDE_12508 [Halotydeus destructor]
MVLANLPRLNCSGKGTPDCKLLALGFPYDFAEIERGDGKLLTVFFSKESPAAFMYIAAIVVVYFVVFMAFFIFTIGYGLTYRPRPRKDGRQGLPVERRRVRRRKRLRLPLLFKTKSTPSVQSLVMFDASGSRTLAKKVCDEQENPHDDVQYV